MRDVLNENDDSSKKFIKLVDELKQRLAKDKGSANIETLFVLQKIKESYRSFFRNMKLNERLNFKLN